MEGEQMVKLRIQSPRMNLYDISFPVNSTVKELRIFLAEKVGRLNYEHTFLSCNGNVLEHEEVDDCSLSELEIGDGSRITMRVAYPFKAQKDEESKDMIRLKLKCEDESWFLLRVSRETTLDQLKEMYQIKTGHEFSIDHFMFFKGRALDKLSGELNLSELKMEDDSVLQIAKRRTGGFGGCGPECKGKVNKCPGCIR